MTIIIDRPCIDKCWNLYDSYGEICVGCGCCSKDPLTRTENRLRVLERQLHEEENFNDYAYEYPDMVEMQKKNHESNLLYYKKQIACYKGWLTRLKRRCNK